MSIKRTLLVWFLILILALIGIAAYLVTPDKAQLSVAAVAGTDPMLGDERAESVPTVGVLKPIGWKANEVPHAAQGLAVTRFADKLDHPRIVYTLPNGDVLVAQSNRPASSEPGGLTGLVANWLFAKAGADVPSPNTIVLLRDTNGDGAADQRAVLGSAFNSPGGMAWKDGTLYVADTDALMAFPYTLGSTSLGGPGKKLMDLPGGGMHWMRNIALSPDGNDLYVSVGSSSNIAENGIETEQGRAAIWDYNLKTGRPRIYGTGMRNPNGLAFNPWSGELWTTVNERDMLGSDLVPDYLTNVPIGTNYGWPWVYWRNHFDIRVDAPRPPEFNPDYIRIPEYALGPHVAALGLAFSGEGNRLGAGFAQGAFVARHGSWNRMPVSGYDVVFVKFDDRGNPVGKPVPVLTGFIAGDGKTHGRPTWVSFAKDGALLVSDDTAGIIWRVIAPGAAPAKAIERLGGDRLPPQRELRGQEATFGGEDYARITTQ
ncbi:MAG: PQQ-dependent sugar dehydrogenase [Tsuneonella sp.]